MDVNFGWEQAAVICLDAYHRVIGFLWEHEVWLLIHGFLCKFRSRHVLANQKLYFPRYHASTRRRPVTQPRHIPVDASKMTDH